MNRSKTQLPSRGRGQRTNRNSLASKENWHRNNKKNGIDDKQHFSNAQERFNEATQKHQKNVQEALQQKSEQFEYESSSSEEELDDEIILSKLTEVYQDFGKVSDDNLKITSQYLTECCQSGALTCLVCISSIKRTEAVWNCKNCYACFHLECIRKWILEGIAKASLLSDEHFPKREQPWHCPKCRHEYTREECPTEYFCFCGKVRDPEYDMWTLPHSCGAICGKYLENPKCGHQCVLLCHPGPCPPCPQTVKLSCHCGRSKPTMKRCGVGKDSCGQICNKMLSCGVHRCQDICHPMDCKPCQHTTMKRCACGKEQRLQPCAQPLWRCEAKCKKPLSCGHHFCEKVCHPPGECGKCPHDSSVRTCPCGKQKYYNLSCIDEALPCDDTCEKSLNCFGNHRCNRRCHKGECGSCTAVVNKTCRCGKREKRMACHKPYICDNKCLKMRTCGRHPCKRKCCEGNCPPCEQTCNKHLQCKTHKCQMTCHQGPCYPCILTTIISCPCGATSLTVVCGKQRTTKPPRCTKPCKIASNCHHPQQVIHKCHEGTCPTCKQICGLRLSCGHLCPEPCHDNVPSKKVLRPWEPISNLVEKLPCPPCVVPVGVACKGKHDIFMFECHQAREHSCGRSCGRLLACTNHACQLNCHVIEGAPDDIHAGTTCAPCESECLKPRPKGCTHDCILPCHPGECPLCKKKIRKRCFCGILQLKFLCHEWTSSNDEERVTMQSCTNQCPKKLQPCGHQCPRTCHPGECPTSFECQKKVVLRCQCKRLKKDFQCWELQKTSEVIKCDDVCKKLKKTRAIELQAAEEKKIKEEKASKVEAKTEETKSSSVTNRKSRKAKSKPSTAINNQICPPKKKMELLSPLVLSAFGVVGAVLVMIVIYYNQQL